MMYGTLVLLGPWERLTTCIGACLITKAAEFREILASQVFEGFVLAIGSLRQCQEIELLLRRFFHARRVVSFRISMSSIEVGRSTE